MAYCSRCGKAIGEGSFFCADCAPVNTNQPPYTQYAQPTPPPPQYQQPPYYQKPINPDDAPSGGFAFLSFFFPLIGFILWLVWKDESPRKAKSCGKGALIGFCSGIIFTIVFVILYSVLVVSLVSDYSSYYPYI